MTSAPVESNLLSVPTDRSDLIPTTAAAQRLGIHPKTLMRWVRDGLVTAVRTPGGRLRFRPEDLDTFVASRTEEAS